MSMCSMCCAAVESTDHIFLRCGYAQSVWLWLGSILHLNIDLSSTKSVLSVCSKQWSSQLADIVLAAVLNCFWVIWNCRNSSRFHNKILPITSAINLVKALVSLTGNQSPGFTSSSMFEFSILKSFKIDGKVNKALLLKQVDWYTPLGPWIKCNTDGAARGSPGIAACGGIFRNRMASILGCFTLNIGMVNSLTTEFTAAILAIEIALKNNWSSLWLECDSMLVVDAFKSPSRVPWKLRCRWKNCQYILANMNFQVSHIFREGNCCANRLADYGISSQVLLGGLQFQVLFLKTLTEIG